MNLATVFNRSSPNVAAMLVIMHRHGAQTCEYTRILADALCKAGQSKEAAIARTMAVRIALCQEEIPAIRRRGA